MVKSFEPGETWRDSAATEQNTKEADKKMVDKKMKARPGRFLWHLFVPHIFCQSILIPFACG